MGIHDPLARLPASSIKHAVALFFMDKEISAKALERESARPYNEGLA